MGGFGRIPPEWNRRRHDQKTDYGYNRLLGFINRTYGSSSEYLEFLTAFQNNPEFMQFVTALGLNQAVDRYYGERANWLKQNVYSSQHWRLPVGYDALSRLWR